LNSRIKKTVAVFIILSVFTVQNAAAAPSLSFGILDAERNPVFSLELPFELGTIEEIRPAASRKNAPVVIAIQTLHGHYETALKIRELSEFFYEKLGTDLAFFEGASGQVHPEFLRFSDDDEKNAAVLDDLTRRGEVTGADLTAASGRVKGIGVETAAGYRKSYDLFKDVLGQRDKTERALEERRLALERNASRIIRPELRDILSHWLKFGENRLELMAAVDFLREGASRLLGTDLRSAAAQFDWPQMTRLVLLNDLSKKRNETAWTAEASRLAEKLRGLGLDASFVEFLGSEEKGDGPAPRRRAEKFLTEAAPKGFRLSEYPQAVYRAAYRIIESELDSHLLYEEIETMFERLLIESTGNADEEKILRDFRRLVLAAKLTRLEMTPSDWREWRAQDSGESGETGALKEALRLAEAFYDSMEERERAFLEAVETSLRSGKEKTAVFISGGFHAREMMDRLESAGIASVLVTPHISGSLENGLYHKVMLRSATLEQTLFTNDPAASKAQGWDTAAQADAVRGILAEQGITDVKGLPYFSALEGDRARSELRASEETGAVELLEIAQTTSDFDQNPFPAVEKLGEWFAPHRWFMEKGSVVRGVEYVDAFILGEESGRSAHGLIIRLNLTDSEARSYSKQYYLPVIVSASKPAAADAETVRVLLTNGERYLSLAEHQAVYQRIALEHFQRRSRIPTWNRGQAVFTPFDSTLDGIPAGGVDAAPLGVSTSNVLTKVTSGGTSFVSKTYKDMRGASGQDGTVWPANTEVAKYEALVKGGFPYMPPLYGTLEYVDAGGNKTALGLMMKAVGTETEAGGVFWEGLTRFMKDLKESGPGEAEERSRKSLEGAAAFARELARTVAEMHGAFLKSGQSGFTAAPAKLEEIFAWGRAGRHHLGEALLNLEQRLAAAPGDENLARLKEEFAKRRGAIAEAKSALTELEGILMKAPVHGDLSTAQGLIEALGDEKLNAQFWDTAERGDPELVAEKAKALIERVRWLDFEGPPAKDAVSPDFDQRENWLKDVAGVLEGFWYIANIQLFGFLDLKPIDNPADREEARKASLVLAGFAEASELSRPVDPEIIRLINRWVTQTTDAFLNAYFDTIERDGYGNAILSRWDRGTARSLVDYYLMERATHEFQYEFYAREWGWEGIPGTRILQLTDSGRLASAADESKTYTASGDTVFGGALTEVPEVPEKEFSSPVDAGIPVDGVFLPFHHMRHEDDWGVGNFYTAKVAGDFAQALGYHVMQDLPFTYSSAGNSPYSVLSALLLDPVYLSAPEAVRTLALEGITVPGWEKFLEDNRDTIRALQASPQIRHQDIINLNLAAVRLIWAAVQGQTDSETFRAFETFKAANREMAEDDLLYLQLKSEQASDWRQWDAGVRDRDPSALAAARERLKPELEFQAFVQYLLEHQKKKRDEHYRKLGVSTMVDMAFAPPDAEIWKNPAAVGMNKANGYKRDAVQGVPGKKEAPVGQLWNFSVYDWSNPAALSLFIKVFKINLDRADYLRVDHTLGLYRIFVFLQKGLSLEALGIRDRIEEIRTQALEESTDAAKERAVAAAWELIRTALIEKGRELGLPPEVFTLLFDEAGQLRKGGAMVMAARRVPKELHGQNLPMDSRWQRFHWEEDDLYDGEPKWDTIRLTANERAQDNGDIRAWLFPEDGHEPPRPDDQIRLGYFRLSPGETAMAELAGIAQERGKKLIFETLGTVPAPIQASSSRFGNNYYPLVYGLDPSSWYHPLKIKTRSGMMTFNVADTGSPAAAWAGVKDWANVKGPAVRAFFPELPGEQFEPHMSSVTPPVHEKLLEMVYDPQGIYPQIANGHLPLIALLGLLDIANLPEEYRLNIPGLGGQWINKLPETLSLENLAAAAKGEDASEEARDAVRVVRALQEKRKRHSPLTTPADIKILRTTPDVTEDGIQIRIVSKEDPASTPPFFTETYVQGEPLKVELVVRSRDGMEARFDAKRIRSARGETAAVSNWGAMVRPLKPGVYEFRFEVEKPGEPREATASGRLIAVEEGADLNPMSPGYVLTADARGFRSEMRADLNPRLLAELAWKEADAADILMHFRALMAKYAYPLPRKIIQDGKEMEDGQGGIRYAPKPFTYENLKAFRDSGAYGPALSPAGLYQRLANALSLSSFLSEAWEMPKPFYDYFGILPKGTVWFIREELKKSQDQLINWIRRRAEAGQMRFSVVVQGAWHGEEAFAAAIMLRETFPALSFEIHARDFVEPNPDELNWAAGLEKLGWLKPKLGEYFHTVAGEDLGPAGSPAGFKAYILKDEWRGLVNSFAQGDITRPESFVPDADIVIATRVLGRGRYVTKEEDIRRALENSYGALKAGGLLVLTGEEDVAEILGASFKDHFRGLDTDEGLYQKMEDGEVRSELRSGTDIRGQESVRNLDRSEPRDAAVNSPAIPALQMPFLADGSENAVFGTAFLSAGMADPDWNEGTVNDYRLALRRVVEARLRGRSGESLEAAVGSLQTVLRENKQVIALFARLRDISDEETLRQIFDSARFLIRANEAQAHYVALTVEREEDVASLREKLLDFLKREYPEDAAVRNQIYSRMPVVTAAQSISGREVPKGALTVRVDWTAGAEFNAVLPVSADEKRIQADRLPDGALLRFDEKNLGFGVSLLQAAALLLQGAEASGLRQLKTGIFVQAGTGAFENFGRLYDALRMISASA